MGKKITYFVKDERDTPVAISNTPIGAKREANAYMREHKIPVYVSWFRESDHQHGGLSQDGDHNITSRRWDPEKVPPSKKSKTTPKKRR